jgi:dUTP pyrophosphatase
VLDLPVARLDPGAVLPAYARNGDAGLDLVANEPADLAPAGGRAVVGTGVAVAIPAGWCGLVLPRSGLAANHGVTVLNAPGLIDSGYRGEVRVPLVNLDPHVAYRVARGDRIAQLLLQPVPHVVLQEQDAFDGEHRGGGFGHTGR